MGQELMPAHGLHFRTAGAALTLRIHAIFILILQAVTLTILQQPQPFGKPLAKSFHIEVLVHSLTATLEAPTIFYASFQPAFFGRALCQSMAKPRNSGLM
jgi:hypothetical protein